MQLKTVTLAQAEPVRITNNIDADLIESVTLEDYNDYDITNVHTLAISIPTGEYHCRILLTMGTDCSVTLPESVTSGSDDITGASVGQHWEISADYAGGKHLWIVKNWGVIA